tara:strand:- start:749 stop:1186 length:438 start_codon:yes stop_codon:yes gene_type:complete
MFSIDIDKNIITDVIYDDVNLLYPHERIIDKNKNILKEKFINSHGIFFISSIIICNESGLIIDGHHRYNALKELGLSKIPVTKINYKSKKIKTSKKNDICKNLIIKKALSKDLFKPKSTRHLILCERQKQWFPITLISTLFQVKL